MQEAWGELLRHPKLHPDITMSQSQQGITILGNHLSMEVHHHT